MANEMVTIDKTEIEGFRSESSTLIERAKMLAREIKDAATLDNAAKMMLEAKSRVKRIAERLREPKAAARAAWQGWTQLEDELCEPYRRIENDILKPAMSLFTQEQHRKRRQEEDRLRAEARKREEDERIKSAIALEQRGDKELANFVLETPVAITPVVLPKVEQPKGISYRDIWRYRIVNESIVPREYLCLDEQKIGGVVRSLKDAARIPGIEVYSEKVVAGRV